MSKFVGFWRTKGTHFSENHSTINHSTLNVLEYDTRRPNLLASEERRGHIFRRTENTFSDVNTSFFEPTNGTSCIVFEDIYKCPRIRYKTSHILANGERRGHIFRRTENIFSEINTSIFRAPKPWGRSLDASRRISTGFRP